MAALDSGQISSATVIAPHAVVVDEVDHGVPTPAPAVGHGCQLVRLRDVELAEQRRSSDSNVVSVDVGTHTATGQRLEAGGGGERAGRSPGGNDGAGDGVFAVALGCRREAEHLISVVAGDGGVVDDGVVAACERAGLVEQHGVDVAHPFQRQAVLDEDPGASRDRRGDRDHERDRQTESVRAGDHEHGDNGDDSFGRLAERTPHDHRRRSGEHGDVEQCCCGTVGEGLGARP